MLIKIFPSLKIELKAIIKLRNLKITMRIVSLMSTKGGVGKTTIAINLSLALQNFNRKTALLDFNFTTPHIALYFNLLNQQKTLNSFLKGECQFSETLYHYSPFLSIVPTSIDVKDVVAIDGSLKNLLEENLKDFEFVIIDAAPGLGKEALISLNSSQEIIFVATPDLVSIVDVTKTVKLINSLQEKPIVWGIILNRVKGKAYELSKEEIERYSGLPVLATVKENEDFVKALNERKPAYFYSNKIKEEFDFLAAKIAGIPYEKKSWIARILERFFKKPARTNIPFANLTQTF